MSDTKDKWIVMQDNLGHGHKGQIIITTQERVNNNQPMIAKDIIDKEHAHKICRNANSHDDLLAACKHIVSQDKAGNFDYITWKNAVCDVKVAIAKVRP